MYRKNGLSAFFSNQGKSKMHVADLHIHLKFKKPSLIDPKEIIMKKIRKHY